MLRIVGYGLQVFCRGYKIIIPVLLFAFFEIPLFSQVFTNNLENTSYENHWINLYVDDSLDSHSGNHYAVTDSLMTYGLGLELPFPENLQGTNSIVFVNGWVKSDMQNDNALFVTTVSDKGKTVFWDAIDLSGIILEQDIWFEFSNSVVFPTNITNEGIFKTFLWNNDQKNHIAIDDLKIEFKRFSNPSFIPDVSNVIINEEDKSDELLMANDYYSIYYNDAKNSLSIFSKSGSPLIKNIWYHDERKSEKFDIVRNVPFNLKSIKQKNEKTRLRFVAKHEYLSLEMEIVCSVDSPEIHFFVKEKYTADQVVSRESIVVQSGQEAKEVFRTNRKSDLSNIQHEYWIGKQGVKFGDKSDSWLVYHQPNISSFQLNTQKNQLWINLDYKKDHPFLHFPLNNDTTDLKEDWSKSAHKKGDKWDFSFSIFAGSPVGHLPRFMRNPNGYLATYIWTEHADFTDIRTNRATYFGSENIRHPDSAVGGFVKYHIPVTKSVFYSNPDQVTNKEISKGHFTGLESAILSDTAFDAFLSQLHEKGHEICLHTPEQFTADRETLSEALTFMKNRFDSPTWIDHGYNNHSVNNREDLVCDGTLKKSDFYAMDLWQKNGVGYFWNPYYEDYNTFNDKTFGAYIDKPYHGYGDHIPDPDFWQHPSSTSQLWHWPTKSVLYVENDELWDYYFGDQVMNDFVESWGVEINHCYPAWVDPAKGFWFYNEDGIIISRNGFNRTLKKMAELRDSGLLNVTTIQKFLDYQLAVKKVSYRLLPDGRIKISNEGFEDIQGLSFATRAKVVLVNDFEPDQKIIGEDIIFWFDIVPGETKLIRIID